MSWSEIIPGSLMVTLLTGMASAAYAAEASAEKSMQTQAGLYVDARESYAMLHQPGDRDVVLIDVRDPVRQQMLSPAPVHRCKFV